MGPLILGLVWHIKMDVLIQHWCEPFQVLEICNILSKFSLLKTCFIISCCPCNLAFQIWIQVECKMEWIIIFMALKIDEKSNNQIYNWYLLFHVE